MTSTFAPVQPRSPTSINSRRSKSSKCSIGSERIPLRWRSNLYSKQNQLTREGSLEAKSNVSGELL